MEYGSKFETSKAEGKHRELGQLVGTWEGITSTWFEPGKLADESQWRGTIRPLLDGRFVLHEYEGTLMGTALKGIAMYGYNLIDKKYECAWVDNCHTNTALMFFNSDENTPNFSVLGSYAIPDHPRWGWRIVIDMPDSDHLTITMYNITPDGQEAKGVETLYTRVGE